jgi:hypothetical protein
VPVIAEGHLIYIDLNHWIGLSKARLGRSGSEVYAALLEELREAVSAGRATVPLSFAHYIEMSKIKDPKQRSSLALVMGDLSNYVTLTSREDLLAYELRRSIARELGRSYQAAVPPLTGYGFGHAFGQPQLRGKLRGHPEELQRFAEANADAFIPRLEEHVGSGWKVPSSGGLRTKLEAVNNALDAAAQFMMLMGPRDDALPGLRQIGYNPNSAYEVVASMTRRESDLAASLAKEPANRKRLDDIVAARAMFWDLLEIWSAAVMDVWQRLITIEELGKDRLSRILSDTPIINVESSVRRANFRNSSKGWDQNDLYDLAFVGVAVAYCSVVLTERHLQSVVRQEKLDQRYQTTVLRRPEELTERLRSGRDKPGPVGPLT